MGSPRTRLYKGVAPSALRRLEPGQRQREEVKLVAAEQPQREEKERLETEKDSNFGRLQIPKATIHFGIELGITNSSISLFKGDHTEQS